MKTDNMLKVYNRHQGEIIGACIGLGTAVLILIINFWRVLFIAICVGIGYYIGKRLSDDKEYIKNLLDRILPPGTYR